MKAHERICMMKESSAQSLIDNIERLHTTSLGQERIKRNLNLDVKDVLDWCVNQILNKKSDIIRKGKKWYITTASCVITVNTKSYTVITAHKTKERKS